MLLPERKTTRLSPSNYHGRHLYFVTLCCFERRKVFRVAFRCRWLLEFIQMEATARYFCVPAYCIMPDHCHLLLEAIDESSDLLHFMKSLKIKTSRRFWEQERQPLWQRSYFDHILRRSEEIESVAWYIWLNPVRKGLVRQPQDYTFAGSLTGLQMPPGWKTLDWKPDGG